MESSVLPYVAVLVIYAIRMVVISSVRKKRVKRFTELSWSCPSYLFYL